MLNDFFKFNNIMLVFLQKKLYFITKTKFQLRKLENIIFFFIIFPIIYIPNKNIFIIFNFIII